ncbi:hypothetical protein E2C01_066812 [Portunus trituberculatus]|uniref:Uncharacterized protein n=1 Tax=Portunus trituberculatus TaxID=210409 RepID=A0A5B7HQU9_PORTR|nr:hypothetical protein [Portunus trituberculatus]
MCVGLSQVYQERVEEVRCVRAAGGSVLVLEELMNMTIDVLLLSLTDFAAVKTQRRSRVSWRVPGS